MTKAPVIELYQVRHTLKVGAVTGQARLRDVALLAVLYSTGVTSNEAAKLVVSDYLAADAFARVESTLRPEIAFNSKTRPLVLANGKAGEALDDYLRYHLRARHGISTADAAFRGPDPSSPFFWPAMVRRSRSRVASRGRVLPAIRVKR